MEPVAGTERIVIDLADGRRVEAFVDDDHTGVPIVFHHGTPGCGRPLTVLVEAARAEGFRWVSLSRPGFGSSTRLDGRRVGDIAGDTAAVLDHLGIAECVVAGWSGGGPHALACGALIPDRVAGALVIAGCAPYPAEGLDWLAGMSESEEAEARAAIEDPDALRRLIDPRRAWYGSATGEELMGALVGRFPEVDIAALAPHATEFVSCIAEAVAPGIDAWIDDWRALVRPWGFDVTDVVVPVVLWQGTLDESCPLAHARWLHDHLPTSTLVVRDGEGHLSIGVAHPRQMFHDLTTAIAGEVRARPAGG